MPLRKGGVSPPPRTRTDARYRIVCLGVRTTTVIYQRCHAPCRLAAGAQYWAENVPWSFRDLKEKPSYDARRTMRYNLQDYMSSVIPFRAYSGKKVLRSGAGQGWMRRSSRGTGPS